MINVCRQAARENSIATSICRSTFCMTSRWRGDWGHHMQEHFTLPCQCQSINYYSCHTRISSSFMGMIFTSHIHLRLKSDEFLFSLNMWHKSASQHIEVIADSKAVSHLVWWTFETQEVVEIRAVLNITTFTLASNYCSEFLLSLYELKCFETYHCQLQFLHCLVCMPSANRYITLVVHIIRLALNNNGKSSSTTAVSTLFDM